MPFAALEFLKQFLILLCCVVSLAFTVYKIALWEWISVQEQRKRLSSLMRQKPHRKRSKTRPKLSPQTEQPSQPRAG